MSSMVMRAVAFAVLGFALFACDGVTQGGKPTNLSAAEKERVLTIAQIIEPPYVNYTIASIYAAKCPNLRINERQFDRDFASIEDRLIGQGYLPFEIFDATYFLDEDHMASVVHGHFDVRNLQALGDGDATAFCAAGQGERQKSSDIGRFLR